MSGLIMDKRIQALLLVLIFSIAASARLAVLGWLMMFAFGSVILFGLIHFLIHFYCMNNLAASNSRNVLRIVISHLLFASILLFQMDFDDSRSYSTLGNMFGFGSNFLERQGYSIVGIALVLYIIQSFIIIRTVRKDRIKGSNSILLISSLLLAFILPNAFSIVSYRAIEYEETKSLEETGEFESLKRALKSPTQVETLSISPYNQSLSEFPQEVFELHELKHLNLKGHSIESIPDNISDLTKLETLNLLDNNLQAINPKICDCSQLVELRIGGEITSIPDCLKKMKTLKHLSFQSTYVNELLDELREFENIQTAHFYLKTPPVDFGTMTDEETIEHFKNSEKFDDEKWKKISEETGIKHKY
tara:strand:+ start:1958 stop:3043 length:1086 start_codon:yes stop_codon:yes gene_type:complete